MASVRHKNAATQLGFTMIPNAVLLDTSLSLQARIVYAALKSFAWEKVDCYPGQKKLSEIIGVSERSIRGYLTELVDAGLLEMRKKSWGGPNLYTLLDPNPAKSAALVDGSNVANLAAQSGNQLPGKKIQEEEALPNGRARDPLWDTLVDLFGAEAQGKERGRWNAAIKSLKEQKATPDQIVKAAAAYRASPTFRDCEMTPLALTSNWTLLTANGKTPHEIQGADLRARIQAQEGR